jgi:hypothetical protein
MKKITYFFVLLIAFVGFTNEIYCQATEPPCNTDSSFVGFDIYDIAIFNFTTTDGVTNIDNTSTDGTETSAIDYTSQYLEVYSGAEASVPFSVLVGSQYFTTIQISLDSNQDGQFTSTEVLYDVYGIYGENTGTIAIPGTLAEGDYNLRVATVYNKAAYYDTCSLISEIGEIEDYTLRVSAPPSCLPPSGLTVASITNITATVSYTAGATETAWEYVVQPDGTGEPTGAGTASTTNPIPLTGLAGNTAYEVYLRASCGGDYSIWKKTTFTTQCDPFSADWSNDFENTDTDNSLDCWEITNSGGSNSFSLWDIGSTQAMGILGEATAAHDDYLASPAFTVTDGVSDRFTFDATSWDSAGLNNFDVQIWDQDNSALIATIASGVKPLVFQQFDTFFYDLSAYEGQNIRVIFYVGTTTNNNNAHLFFDNVVVDGYPNCLAVSDLTVAVETTTTTTASVSWTAGATETAWEYVVQADGTGEPTGAGTATTTNPLSLTGLTLNTAYEVYVRASCGGDYSIWEKTTFNTRCDVLTAPYTQEFTTMTIIEGSEFTIENCWSANNSGVYWEATAATDPSSNNTGPGSGVSDGNYMLFEASSGQENDTAILNSPSIDLNSLTTPRLSFDYHMFGANMGSLEVSIIDSSSETLLQTISGQQQTAETEPFINLLTDLSSYSGSVYFKFTAKKGIDYDSDIAIDNFKVEETPSCLPPSGLTVASITNNSASLSFTNGGSETRWEYVVQPDGTGEPNGAGTASTTNPIPLTGLAGNTAYEVYVRASCGFSDFSTWEKTTFTTECDVITSRFTNSFDDNAFDCWDIENSDGGNAWSLKVHSTSQNQNNVAFSLLYDSTAHNDYLYSPTFSVIAGETIGFSFKGWSTSSSYVESINVYVTDASNTILATLETDLVLPFPESGIITEFTYDLSAYIGTDVRIAFHSTTTDVFYAVIDDFTVGPLAVWTGEVDDDFSNPSNWSSGDVPDANSDITIASNSVIDISQNITFNSMNISAGASIISSGTMTGPVTFTRNLPSSDWYLISSPVVGQDIDAFVSASNLAVGSSGTSNLGFANYDNNTEVWSYYQSGATGTGNFIPGKGHSVKSAFSSNNISFTGTFNDADASIALANNTNGYNLIGNPYLASVSVVELLSANSALLSEQTAWLWDESVDAYVQKNLAEDLELAPGQGFFVLANTAGSFTITEAMQSHSSDTFQRPTSRPEINIVMSNGKDSRNTNVYYIDGTTTGWDNGYDSSIFAGLANEFAIYTHVITNGSGRNLGIQSLPDNNYENMVIPVGIHAESETTITISATINNLPTGMNVYLEDKQENSYTLLEAGANFTTKLESNLSGIGRFYIHTTTSTLSAGDFVLNNNLSIYSTSKENLRIIGLQDGTANLQLYNAIGKEVLRTSFIGNGVNDILLPNLETGVYILKLATEAGSTNKKLIIK